MYFIKLLPSTRNDNIISAALVNNYWSAAVVPVNWLVVTSLLHSVVLWSNIYWLAIINWLGILPRPAIAVNIDVVVSLIAI